MTFLYTGYKKIRSDAANNVIYLGYVQMNEHKGITHSVRTGVECPEEVSGVSLKRQKWKNNPPSKAKSVCAFEWALSALPCVSTDIRKPGQSAHASAQQRWVLPVTFAFPLHFHKR